MRFARAEDGTYRMTDGGLQPASMPSSATRSSIRRLVPQETLDAIEQSAEATTIAGPKSAAVNDVQTIEELKADWLCGPVVRLIQAVGLLSRDLSSKSIGRGTVTKRIERVASRAAEVADVYEFLSCFRSDLLEDVWLPIVRASTQIAADLKTALTADTDGESSDACDHYEELRHQFEEEGYSFLARLPNLSSTLALPSSREEYLSEIFGADLGSFDSDATGAGLDRFRAAGLDPSEVAQSRFAFLDSLDFREEEFFRSYSFFAIRLADSECPLLAHRSLQLSARLLGEADEAEPERTRDLVISFFQHEASWVVASAPAYEKALRDYIENGELLAVVEALRHLSEGVLRPYGSLIAAIAETMSASSASGPLAVAPTLGELEQRLDGRRSEIEALIVPLVRREWRNADAHARATVSPTGQLAVRLDDGSTEEINPDAVHRDVAMLRSVLDGIDAAVNLFFATTVVAASDLSGPFSPGSKEMTRNVVVEAVHRMGHGPVTNVAVSEEELQVTLKSVRSRGELENVLFWLGRVTLGRYPMVSAVDEEGNTLAKMARICHESHNPEDVVYLPEWITRAEEYLNDPTIPRVLAPRNMDLPCKCGHPFGAHRWHPVRRRIRIRLRDARYRDVAYECKACECEKFRGVGKLRYA